MTTALAATSAILLALAAPAAAQKDGIVLQVYNVDHDGEVDPIIEPEVEINYRSNKTADRRVLEVTGPQDFAVKLRRLRDEGVRIRRLYLQAHGRPGGNTIIDDDSLPSFQGLDDAFVPGAEVLFQSCSVGQGEEGMRFLKNMGRTLLPKGGRITAPVWTYLTMGSTKDRVETALLTPAPLWAKPFIIVAGLRTNGVSPLGNLRYDAPPGGGDGSFTYLQPGVAEVREQVQTTGDQFDEASYRLECGVRRSVLTAADVLGLQLEAGRCRAGTAQRAARKANKIKEAVEAVRSGKEAVRSTIANGSRRAGGLATQRLGRLRSALER